MCRRVGVFKKEYIYITKKEIYLDIHTHTSLMYLSFSHYIVRTRGSAVWFPDPRWAPDGWFVSGLGGEVTGPELSV